MKSASVQNILIATCLYLLSSCSPAQQISRSAEKNVLTDSSLLTAHVGISIYEPATGKYWYNYQGDKYFVPASNTKIPTCYAAMKYLGDSLVGLRYQTINDSLVNIKATGDPTFLHRDFKIQPTYSFLKKFKFISFTGDLFADDFLGSGWTWNDFTQAYAAQRSDFPIYGNTVRFAWMNQDSITVTPRSFFDSTVIAEPLKSGFEIIKPWETNAFLFLDGKDKSREVPFRPDPVTIEFLLRDTLKNLVNRNFDKEGYAHSTGATFLKDDGRSITIPLPQGYTRKEWRTLHSQPTDSLLKPMMHRSDNFFAEQSLLMVSNELLGVMNDARIIDTLLKTDFKDLPQKPRWADGSGLSRYNLFTPQDFVSILNKMKNEFGMERVKEILPTGNEGTLSNYYKEANGYIFAKTGSLSGVVALSGFLYTKKDKLLIFSVLVNNHQASAAGVRRAVEKFLLGIRNKF